MKTTTLSLNDPSYPAQLQEIHSPPKKLYILGPNVDDISPSVAIVGSRKPTSYGIGVTKQLAEELAQRGFTIISGLAHGVDGIAHRAALKVGGRTIAVMPCGLDFVYPAAHRQLAKDILAQGGSLVSEYPQGSTPYRSNFVARNRIVSGLADAVLVTEATAKSGTLITVRFGLEQGRTILSVPGDITSPLSEGTNTLIKRGATPVTEVKDILHVMGLEDRLDHQPTLAMSADEQAIIHLLDSGVNQQDELLLKSKLPVTAFNSTLTMLEITGRVENIGQGQWILR